MADFSLPFDVVEAAIAAIGKCFYYKHAVNRLLRKCGVSESFVRLHQAESKYVIARTLFSELEGKGDAGRMVALRIVRELCDIRAIADDMVDKASAFGALTELRRLFHETRIDEVKSEIELERRAGDESARLEKLATKTLALQRCKSQYSLLLASTNAQARGFEFEKLLSEVFAAHEIAYRKSYRDAVQQTDGAFKFEAFDYLVEAKWTKDETDLAVLDSFQSKVGRKLSSTRGLFISVAGFSQDVVDAFTGGYGRSVILMSGEDLNYVLEGYFTLPDALEIKTGKAAHEGVVFAPLRDLL